MGEFASGDGYLQRLLDAMDASQPGPSLEYAFSSLAIPWAARLTGDDQRFDIAYAAIEAVSSHGASIPLVNEFINLSTALLAVHRGDAVAIRNRYDAISDNKHFGLAVFIGLEPVLGLLAHSMGEPDRASTHFEDSLDFCRKAGFRPRFAWLCCGYADALLERDGQGDRAKAISLLDEALSISSELGMRPLMERVLSRRKILEA